MNFPYVLSDEILPRSKCEKKFLEKKLRSKWLSVTIYIYIIWTIPSGVVKVTWFYPQKHTTKSEFRHSKSLGFTGFSREIVRATSHFHVTTAASLCGASQAPKGVLAPESIAQWFMSSQPWMILPVDEHLWPHLWPKMQGKKTPFFPPLLF